MKQGAGLDQPFLAKLFGSMTMGTYGNHPVSVFTFMKWKFAMLCYTLLTCIFYATHYLSSHMHGVAEVGEVPHASPKAARCFAHIAASVLRVRDVCS
jgi:hypothetical protein